VVVRGIYINKRLKKLHRNRDHLSITTVGLSKGLSTLFQLLGLLVVGMLGGVAGLPAAGPAGGVAGGFAGSAIGGGIGNQLKQLGEQYILGEDKRSGDYVSGAGEGVRARP
jgi:hypothetical protein